MTLTSKASMKGQEMEKRQPKTALPICHKNRMGDDAVIQFLESLLQLLGCQNACPPENIQKIKLLTVF